MEEKMYAVSSNVLHKFIVAIVSAVAIQTPALGAVWVNTQGVTVGPALDAQTILLQIPGSGKIVVGVGIAVYPTTIGDPIRWQYSFVNSVPSPVIVMSFASSDCTGQGYTRALVPAIGSTVQATQFSDSINDWLVMSSYPAITPAPHFNSQVVRGAGFPPLDGPGAYCQTVDVSQGGSVVPVTLMINQSTLASPAMSIQ
jgi:hypothetical protein